MHHAPKYKMKMNIRHEVGDQIDEVDKVIQVLLKAGMTSDALSSSKSARCGASACWGCSVGNSSALPWDRCCYWLVGMLAGICSCFLMSKCPRFYCILTLMQGLSIVARLGILTIFCRRYIDERCFMLNVMAKTVAPSFFCYVEFKFLQDYHYVTFVSLRCWYHLSFFLTLFFSFLGIRGTLTLGYA